MKMGKIELLAPAGSFESLIAAVQNGADAVYFGTGSFNARASAANFKGEELQRALDYCHARGVDAHITMNTLLLDREFGRALEVAAELYRLGADALIVQDIGLIAALRRCFPDLPIHASTQMTVHNAEGVRACARMGLSRAVLAREVSLEEIRRIRAQSSLPLETFVHGAMCVSESGQCLMSSFLGGRSGNRGGCAQPCRMPCKLGEASGYLLSMKDLCMLEHLEELRCAGVASLKIEGRMKRPEYVATVVSAYRRALDGEVSDFAREKRALMQVFHRGGFSTGYYYGRDGLVAEEKPGHWGMPVGRIAKGVLRPQAPLNRGDELALRRPGQEQDEKIRLPRDAAQGEPIRLTGFEKYEGITAFRTVDARQMELARESFQGEHRLTTVDAELRAVVGQPLSLVLRLDGYSAGAEGEPVQPAQRAPASESKLREQVGKLGGTPFALGGCSIALGETPAFVPASALNELRRRAVDGLLAQLTDSRRREERDVCAPPLPERERRGESPRLIALCAQLEQAEAAVSAGADEIYAQPRQWNRENLKRWSEWGQSCGRQVLLAVPPIVMESEWKEFCGILEEAGTFSGAVASNIGQISCLKGLFGTVRGDYPLNVANSAAGRAYMDLGLESVTASPELTLPQIRDIINKMRAEVLVYGRLPLMNLLHCPIRRTNGGCVGDCAKGRTLVDRKGFEFTLLPLSLRRGMCNVQVLNGPPLDGLKYLEELRRLGADAWRLNFTVEDAAQVEERVSACRTALNGGEALPLAASTGGHFKTGWAL